MALDGPAGRPTKITQERIDAFAELLSKGTTTRAASHAIGVSKDATEDWHKKGRKALREAGDDLDGVPDEPREVKLYAIFAMAVRKAMAMKQINYESVIDNAVNGYYVPKKRQVVVTDEVWDAHANRVLKKQRVKTLVDQEFIHKPELAAWWLKTRIAAYRERKQLDMHNVTDAQLIAMLEEDSAEEDDGLESGIEDEA
jgi:transposase